MHGTNVKKIIYQFQENPSSGHPVVLCGRTDRQTLRS